MDSSFKSETITKAFPCTGMFSFPYNFLFISAMSSQRFVKFQVFKIFYFSPIFIQLKF